MKTLFVSVTVDHGGYKKNETLYIDLTKRESVDRGFYDWQGIAKFTLDALGEAHFNEEETK